MVVRSLVRFEIQNVSKGLKIVAVCTVHVPAQNIEHEQKKSKFPDHWSLSHYFYQRNHNWLFTKDWEYVMAPHSTENFFSFFPLKGASWYDRWRNPGYFSPTTALQQFVLKLCSSFVAFKYCWESTQARLLKVSKGMDTSAKNISFSPSFQLKISFTAFTRFYTTKWAIKGL